MHAAPHAPIQHATHSALHATTLLCFFCDGEAARCDCGKFDSVTEDPITPDGQRRIDAANARREYLRKNPPPVCVEKSSKGMTCEQISYYAGSRCRSCRLQHNASLSHGEGGKKS